MAVISKKKPKYKVCVIRSGTDNIEIREVYPPGQWPASKRQYGYRVKTVYWDEEYMLERELTRTIAQRAPKKLPKKAPLSVNNVYGRYYKAIETEDFIYYFNYKDSDGTVDTIMYRKSDRELVSCNWLASNDLYEILCDSTFTKISRTMLYNYKEIQKELKANENE